MQLPGLERPLISPSKIRDYLLSEAHPIGRYKAGFFAGLGYSDQDWVKLEADLRAHAAENEVVVDESNEYGQKYRVVGRLRGPNGRTAIVETREVVPRLVTALPGARR